MGKFFISQKDVVYFSYQGHDAEHWRIYPDSIREAALLCSRALQNTYKTPRHLCERRDDFLL